MTPEIKAYLEKEISDMEAARQRIVTAAQSQIDLLSSMIENKKNGLLIVDFEKREKLWLLRS